MKQVLKRLGVSLLAVTTAFALSAGSPSGSRIFNQAALTYSDGMGVAYIVSSNMVETRVRQVGVSSSSPTERRTHPGSRSRPRRGKPRTSATW